MQLRSCRPSWQLIGTREVYPLRNVMMNVKEKRKKGTDSSAEDTFLKEVSLCVCVGVWISCLFLSEQRRGTSSSEETREGGPVMLPNHRYMLSPYSFAQGNWKVSMSNSILVYPRPPSCQALYLDFQTEGFQGHLEQTRPGRVNGLCCVPGVAHLRCPAARASSLVGRRKTHPHLNEVDDVGEGV